MAKQGLNDVKAKRSASAVFTPMVAGCICRSPRRVTSHGSTASVFTSGCARWAWALSRRRQLKAARIAHGEAKKLRDAGIDPIIARGAKRQVAASALSVQHASESYIKAQRARWKTARHVKQIRQRLRDYVYPIIGHLPIADIKGAEVRQVLMPIWSTKNPTAGRMRQYMEDVTNWAIHEGIRTDESNPWETKRTQWALPLGIHTVVSHPALSFEQAPAFLAEVRQQKGVKAKALEFTMFLRHESPTSAAAARSTACR